MTLRIFSDVQERVVVLALHGWLSSAEVGEVEAAASARDRPLRIELEHLAGADAEGLRALRQLRDSGVRLTGASPYINLLLEQPEAPAPATKKRRDGGDR